MLEFSRLHLYTVSPRQFQAFQNVQECQTISVLLSMGKSAICLSWYLGNNDNGDHNSLHCFRELRRFAPAVHNCQSSVGITCLLPPRPSTFIHQDMPRFRSATSRGIQKNKCSDDLHQSPSSSTMDTDDSILSRLGFPLDAISTDQFRL